jgi:hypothetical protein
VSPRDSSLAAYHRIHSRRLLVPAFGLDPGIDHHHFGALPQPFEHIGLKFFDQHSFEKH